MVKGLAGLAGALLFVAQGAQAEWSATITGTTDYDFRGVSQTAGDPALQGSLDFESGLFYASIWGSNVDFGPDVDGDLEVDVVAGLAGELDGGWRWDTGATYYFYPGSNEDPAGAQSEIGEYVEFYGGGGWGPVDVRVWWSPDIVESDESAWYTEANVNIALPREFGFTFHYGYSFGDYFDSLETGTDDAEYSDISFALTRSFGRVDSELKLVTTNTDSEFDVNTGPGRNDTRVILSLSTTFPWSDE